MPASQKRRLSSQACEHCRRKRIKCSATYPCSPCNRVGATCEYQFDRRKLPRAPLRLSRMLLCGIIQSIRVNQKDWVDHLIGSIRDGVWNVTAAHLFDKFQEGAGDLFDLADITKAEIEEHLSSLNSNHFAGMTSRTHQLSQTPVPPSPVDKPQRTPEQIVAIAQPRPQRTTGYIIENLEREVDLQNSIQTILPTEEHGVVDNLLSLGGESSFDDSTRHYFDTFENIASWADFDWNAIATQTETQENLYSAQVYDGYVYPDYSVAAELPDGRFFSC